MRPGRRPAFLDAANALGLHVPRVPPTTGRRRTWDSERAPRQSRIGLLDLDDFARKAKRAYRQLAKRYHPDRGGTPADMVGLGEAMETVKRALARERKRRSGETWVPWRWFSTQRMTTRRRTALARR